MVQDFGYRRVQRTGRGSYIISLPKDWVVNSELAKGSQLAVKSQEDSSLLLIPRKILEQREETTIPIREFTIHITENDAPESISRRIMSLYTISADLVRITFREGELTVPQQNQIKNTTRMLLGAEIVEETANKIEIQILMNHPTFPIERAIRRMFAIALIMDRNAISTLKSFEEEQIQSVIDSDSDLDRLNLYVVRQLKYGIEHNFFKELGFRSPKEFLGYRIVVKVLENVGDNAVSTVKNVSSLKQLITNQVLALNAPIDEEVYSSVVRFNDFGHNLLDNSLKALFKRDYNFADKIMSQFMTSGLQLENDAVQLMLIKSLDPNVTSVLRLIIDNSRKMIEYARDIAEVTLNRTVEEISASPYDVNGR